MKKSKASVLVFSLIILFVGLAAAIGIASSVLISQRNSLSTSSSVQSFQVSDSGAEIFLNKFEDAESTDNLEDLGFICSNGVITGNIGTEKEFKITALKKDESKITDCNTTSVSEITRIKSVGSYKNTKRAVEVSVNRKCPQPDDVVGYWKLDETNGSGAYLTDSSSGGVNDGTPTGTEFVRGVRKNARSFNGTSDYVDVGNRDDSLRFTGNGTIEAWVKLDSNWDSVITGSGPKTDRGTIFTKQSDSSEAEWGFRLFVDDDRNPGMEIVHCIGAACHGHYLTSDENLDTDRWYYIVGVLDGSDAHLYVDGNIQTAGPSGTPFDEVSGPIRTGDTQPSFIGGSRNEACDDSFCRFFYGIIDEVRVSDAVLDENYILSNYDCMNPE